MINQLSKLQDLLESVVHNGTRGTFNITGSSHYFVTYALTELDAGFSLMEKGSDEVIFGASTDGSTSNIYPKGLVKVNENKNAEFTKWLKNWRNMLLEKRKEEIATILSEIPDA